MGRCVGDPSKTKCFQCFCIRAKQTKTWKGVHDYVGRPFFEHPSVDYEKYYAGCRRNHMHLKRLPPTHPQWAQAHNFNNRQIYYAGIMRDPQPLVLPLLGWGFQSEGDILCGILCGKYQIRRGHFSCAGAGVFFYYAGPARDDT